MPLFKILAILKELINPQTKNLGICFFKFFLVSILSYTKDFNNLFAIRKFPLFLLFPLFLYKPKIKIMNKDALNKLVVILKEDGKTESSKVLDLIVTEITNTVEAFNLGRDLQSIYEKIVERSAALGVSEEEVLEVMRYVEIRLSDN